MPSAEEHIRFMAELRGIEEARVRHYLGCTPDEWSRKPRGKRSANLGRALSLATRRRPAAYTQGKTPMSSKGGNSKQPGKMPKAMPKGMKSGGGKMPMKPSGKGSKSGC